MARLSWFPVFLIAVSGARASDPGRPKFPDTFTVDIAGLMNNKSVEMHATMYYDRPGNRAALDILYQGERTREIFDYGENRFLLIQGDTCQPDVISKENSFFPYTEDSTSKKKLGSPEETFYFTKSKLAGRDRESDIPVTIYNGTVDVPMYNMKNCKVIHKFSMPEVTMADCDINCKSTLYIIRVICGKNGVFKENIYHFYAFRSRIEDETAFQVPKGVYCPGQSTKPFPVMPKFFCFDYTITEEGPAIAADDNKLLQITYRKMCFDAEKKLVRVDNFDGGRIASTQVYDFENRIGAALTPALEQCNVGPTTDSLTPAEATFLPDAFFSPGFQMPDGDPTYVGLRQSHGLTFHVWSTLTKYSGLEAIKDMYFYKNGANSSQNLALQLSHVEEYYYDVTEDDRTLGKETYVSVGQLNSKIQDWSVFNVSMCFPEWKKKPFQIKLAPTECFQRKSPQTRCPKLNLKNEAGLVDEARAMLYRALTASGNVSVIRMSGLQVTSVSTNELTFDGVILDDPLSLTDTIQEEKPEASLSKAFSGIEKDVRSGSTEFIVYTDDKIVHMTATSFGEPASLEDIGGYTLGAMVGLGLVTSVIGLIIGACIFYVYQRSREAQQRLLANS